MYIPKVAKQETSSMPESVAAVGTATESLPLQPKAVGKWAKDLVKEFAPLFAEPRTRPPRRPGIDHRIVVDEAARPPFQRPYRMSDAEQQELTRQLEKLLDKDFIRPSNSPYGAPVLFVQKPDGSLRLCIDYRGLNKITKRDRYPLPNIADFMQKLAGAKHFSKVDLRTGFNLVSMEPGHEEKTAFTTHMGAFEWRVMPMGLTNAPATFQRLMNAILGNSKFSSFTCVFLDDILIFSNTEEEHQMHVRMVLQALREASLSLTPKSSTCRSWTSWDTDCRRGR